MTGKKPQKPAPPADPRPSLADEDDDFGETTFARSLKAVTEAIQSTAEPAEKPGLKKPRATQPKKKK